MISLREKKMNKGFVVLTVLFEKDEAGWWIATCKELGTAIQSKSLEEAEILIREAMEAHLNSLEEEGERIRFFEENNIEYFPTRAKKVLVDVPLDERFFVKPYVHAVA